MLEKVKATKARHSQGFTLIEAMVVIAILGILTAVALPAFDKLIDQYRIKGVTENIYSDLNYVRSQSMKLGSTVASMTFDATGNGWSYTVNDASGTLRKADAAQFPGTKVFVTPANTSDNDVITLDAKRGTINKVNPAAVIALIQVESRLGAQTRIMVDSASNLKICNASGVEAYASCN